MSDQRDSNESEPKTLKLQRKNHARWFIVLAIIAVVRKRFPEATVIQI
jgi:hypothetical protein